MYTRNHPFDIVLLRWINLDLAHPFLDQVMRFASGYTIWALAALAMLGWCWKNQNRSALISIIVLLVAVSATDALCHSGIKTALVRDWGRPCLTIPWVRLVADKCGNWFTFPSNHAANSMCVAAFWCWRIKTGWLRPLFLFVAILVAFSRVYVGVHFPSDVAAGSAIGAIMGTLFYFVADWFGRKQGSHQASLTQSS